MTPVNEKEVWTEVINMVDVGDRVLGGDDGPINQPIKNLANRTAYLRALVNAVINEAGLPIDNQDTDLLLQAVASMIMKNNQRQPITAGYDSAKKYEAGDLVNVDGEWYECYHPDGCKGKDPRDPVNRPVGWQNTDQSQPYFWLKIGRWLSFPEIGSPIYLPSTKLREGLIKYRNDGNLHKDKFWRLAELYPDLLSNNVINIADLRGQFLRGLDDGRGVDQNRVVNSSQGDAIRNITGRSEIFHVQTLGEFYRQLGAIETKKAVLSESAVDKGASEEMSYFDFDASRVVPTASENRPRNIAMMIATRI